MSKKQIYGGVSQQFAIVDSQSKDAYIWTWPNNHARLSRKEIDGETGQAMPTLVWTHISDSIVQKTNSWRYESAIGHHWSEVTIQTSKNVSMKNLACLPSDLLCVVCLCQCKLSHVKLTCWSKSTFFRFLQGILAILANLGSEGWQGLSLNSLDGYVVCLANKCMFERFVWERHSLIIVILQLTHNSYQDKIRLDHALFCSSEHLLDSPSFAYWPSVLVRAMYLFQCKPSHG